MENLSDDDFRSYMTDFQSYLHNIGDLGPIEPASTAVEAETGAEAGPVNAALAPSSSSPSPPSAAASESSINWSAMNNEDEHRTTTTMMTTTMTTTTGAEMDEQRSMIAEEDDEDRIVAEGCDLDCVTKDPDLIPSQKHSVWFPDVTTRDEDDEVLRGPEVVGEDLMTGSEEDSGYSQVRSEEEKTTKGEDPLNIEGEGGEGWQSGVDADLSRPDVEGNAGKVDREEDDGTGGCDDDHLDDQPMSSSSSAVDGNVSWRYFGDDRIHNEAEEREGEIREPEVATEDDDLKEVTEVEECSPRAETNEQPKQDDEILVDFGEVKLIVDVPPLSSQGFRDEVNNKGEEEAIREEMEEKGYGTTAIVNEEQSLVTSEVTTAGDEMSGSHSANHINPESSHVVADDPGVPSEPTTLQASELGLEEEELDEEEKAFVKEQEAKYWEENARLMASSADEENKNTLIGHEEEVTPPSSDAKQAQQNGAAQLKIYPSQVRKTNNFLSGESQRQDMDASRASEDDIRSPEGENENEEEEKDLPEQGSVKSLLAQWRQMEQQKKQQQTTADAKDDHEHQHQQQRHRRPITSGWSQATPEDDDEIQPTRSRVRDEILRMRSQSCDPMSDRKNNRLSPNDDDVPSVGKRVGRGRSRVDDGEGEGEGAEESAEHYRSQPSLTKAILAKFENLDLQAASTAIKPKSNKNFKWQVKETTRFCRPGFVPRSGR